MRIRLWGIDASESNQLCRAEDSLQYRCGAKATNSLYGVHWSSDGDPASRLRSIVTRGRIVFGRL
ncbi:hypothetical protein AYJ54_17445 [Bradyrhizobium centrolobii]|uniref:Uncharacterized protein n=1 Tax=Bradyrhizobium centrolobii TaxID=1505087 RepID=A0A176YLY0_9BRAD|nr:hypothetical protein AYJ54_17445 [Bradyrhizobium centrolobii]